MEELRRRAAAVNRDTVDQDQYPDCWEYTPEPDVETVVSLKAGFVMRAVRETRVGDWRLRASGATLYLEYWSGSAWTEQAKFEA